MNITPPRIHAIAKSAYASYIQQGRGNLNLEDAAWYTEQFLTESPEVDDLECVTRVLALLLQND